MNKITLDKDEAFTTAQALYWFCANHHNGQFSFYYSVLCELKYKPSPLENAPREEAAIEIYEQVSAMSPNEAMQEVEYWLKEIKEALANGNE